MKPRALGRGCNVNPFDAEAARYDAWFDTPDGRRILALETACLRELIGEVEGRWLEVGVGTGRFAQALGIREGIDPSEAVLEYASGRGIRTQVGRGEDLPYADDSLDGILMVATLCFLADPVRAFAECRRVLTEAGRLIVGLVPADGPWGQRYVRKGREGHRFYSAAKFYRCDQVIGLAHAAGFILAGARSCLFTRPGEPVTDLTIRRGIVLRAGFVALDFQGTSGRGAFSCSVPSKGC